MGNTHQIHRITQALNGAFTLLGLPLDSAVSASLAHMIQRAMSGEGRYYHTPGHALALCDPNHPIQTLAALFHDLVYYQIDHGFAPEIWVILKPYLISLASETGFRLADGLPAGDKPYQLVVDIFGFSPGQKLYANGGSNEFLSSLVMVKKLQGILPLTILAQVTCYIEATIPFRTVEVPGTSPFEKLAQRLKLAAARADLSMDESDIIRTIQGAVHFANLDVANFSSPDPAGFLESTWMLLPEFNPALRKVAEYTLGDYRKALQAMDKFIHSIHAEDVLHEFRGMPPREELEHSLVTIRSNLSLGHAYLEVKLLTMAILEALADISGGDAPVSVFLGEARDRHRTVLKDCSPQVSSTASRVELDGNLDRMLETGVKRPGDSIDLKTSPLAIYLYRSLESQEVHLYIETARELITGKIDPLEFLHRFDPALLLVIADAVSCLAVTRREKIMGVIQAIEDTK